MFSNECASEATNEYRWLRIRQLTVMQVSSHLIFFSSLNNGLVDSYFKIERSPANAPACSS
jgi:hypothetical protein